MPANISNNKKPILITAGGTGGHVFPGLAVARALQAQDIPVVWMGTKKGLEARVIPEAGIDMVYLSVNGLRGKGVLTLLGAPIQLVKALFQSINIMRKVKPAAVLGMGGFVAGPGGLVASLMGIPVVIHEQNAIPGLTNKLLSFVSKRILEGFPGTFKGKKNSQGIGNPVRQDIATLEHPVYRLGNRWGHVHVLIIGGSLGAQALNEVVPMALAELALDKRPVVRHQAGKNKDISTAKLYEKLDVDAEVTPFVEDMAEAYAWADLVICRSGALTVAEIAAVGVASIMVPYPYAVDDHQTANAQYLAQAHATKLVPQDELTKESLSVMLEELCADRNTLIEMGFRAYELAKPDATQDVAAICAEIAGYDFDKNIDDAATKMSGDKFDLVLTLDEDGKVAVDQKDTSTLSGAGNKEKELNNEAA
ncbi:MAG TPA: undecaprenyldiphospho-muramoylpentapeptide beta-N-acetylglucosaminyltransferase [Leucothrix sp.]|nr:undecaprenyldiphospho-muramoylpentapeptide beta-N-acetylglucosaminyltransferase [Leucothrix sp.]